MKKLGIDIGTSSVKLVLMEEETIINKWYRRHHGRLAAVLKEGLETLLPADEQFQVMVTGTNAGVITSSLPDKAVLNDVPATVTGVLRAIPEAGSIIDIGAQNSRFITELDKVPVVSSNEHCAGGTGAFFEDQMARLGIPLEDFSKTEAFATSIPRISGRCSVFAKTDIIHRQQEGAAVPDILRGLCYAMIRNYKAIIVKGLPVNKPIVFTGGVTLNSGAVAAIKDVFSLDDNELIIPEDALYTAAIGAALRAVAGTSKAKLLQALEKKTSARDADGWLFPLMLEEGTDIRDPEATGIIPEGGCALGIDIGSTSTDLVLIGRDGTLVDYQYLRTKGEPEGAVRNGLDSIKERFGDIRFLSVGVTGSGRERIGRLINADAIRDEITSQAKAAVFLFPDAETVFEIGGQDSKYIYIKDGQVADFQMNKVCAAGTGAFIEEQAARMNIPLDEFGPLALISTAPASLGEHCTVFIETAIEKALSDSVPLSDIAAGLCYSIVNNYLHKVVAGRPVGKRIILQGGIAYNPGIVAAFQDTYGSSIIVSPFFPISGAVGAALLSLEAVGSRESSFRGFEDAPEVSEAAQADCEEIVSEAPPEIPSEKKERIGIPMALTMYRFFPLVSTFFEALGYEICSSRDSDEEILLFMQQSVQQETCYPVKLLYGHMCKLVNLKVDHIFFPNVFNIKADNMPDGSDSGCMYMHCAAKYAVKVLRLKENGINFINPTFDRDGHEKAIIEAGISLGNSREECMAAMETAREAFRAEDLNAQNEAETLLKNLDPDEKVIVLVSRNYCVSDSVLNMGIPDILKESGIQMLNAFQLPTSGLDIGNEYPDMRWSFGRHILAAAKIIAHHPNMYAIFLTNHGCGPDTMLVHMFRDEMKDKPYLQIEVDEHFSKVGVITRVEAFLGSISGRECTPLPETFSLTDVTVKNDRVLRTIPEGSENVMILPDIGLYTKYINEYLKQTYSVETPEVSKANAMLLGLGRSECMNTEYLPFVEYAGNAIYHSEYMWARKSRKYHYLIPESSGCEADGHYSQAIRAILDRRGYEDRGIIVPVLEDLPLTAKDPYLLFRAILTADLMYMLPRMERTLNYPGHILNENELLQKARPAPNQGRRGKKIAAVGSAMMLTALNEGVFEQLEKKGYYIRRSPLSEYLLFQWEENQAVYSECAEFLDYCRNLIGDLTAAGMNASTFSADMDELHLLADTDLKGIHGGNIRYRYAKAVQMGKENDAVLMPAPRYENSALILEMLNIRSHVDCPLLQLYFDGDWDEPAWQRLNSFLYYL